MIPDASLERLRVDDAVAPLAVTRERPHFAWAIASTDRNVRQEWYRLRVTGPDGTAWDSGPVESADTLAIEYAGQPLVPSAGYEWTVEAGGSGESGAWVAVAASTFETAPVDWGAARWITIPRARALHEDRRPSPYLRRSIDLERTPTRARLYATAGGLFQPWVNGAPASESTFAPGWTDYNHRVPFHSYDLTDSLRAGRNTIGAILGDGWYSGFIGPFNRRDFWGEVPVFRALLLLEFDGETPRWIATDESWEGAFGAIQASDMLHGEVFDERLELAGWSAGDPEGRWVPAVVETGPTGALEPSLIPPVREVRRLTPVAVNDLSPGTRIVDFGQNFGGRVRLRVSGAAGTLVRLRHAEILDETGGLYLDNLRGARATDTIVLDGRAAFEWEPTFTYHGFRYLEITAPDGCVDPWTVTGVALSSIAEIDGDLTTDSELVNRLQQNIQWSMLSNFFEVPTDCPQRDERLGWGGDAQVFAPTATFNADLSAFYRKWTRDLLDAQKPSGAFADIAPGLVLDFAEIGAAGYADAGVFVPWTTWEAYGDPGVLAEAFPGMQAWIEYIRSNNPGLLWRNDRNSDYGDWLTTDATDKVLVATAHFARAVQVAFLAAEVLGLEDGAIRYRRLHAEIAAAYRDAFIGGEGDGLDTQAAAVFALAFDLALPEQREQIAARLIRDVERRGHLTVGFMAVRFTLPLLCEFGRADLAAAMLFRDETPSWGYQIKRGLTTIGEHWDAWDERGVLLDSWMNSFNHVVLGAVGEWMYRDIGGIAPTEPGYRALRVAPRIDLGISAAECFHVSPYGRIHTRWSVVDAEFRLELTVPANTSATVVLPDGQTLAVGSGTHTFLSTLPLSASQGVTP